MRNRSYLRQHWSNPTMFSPRVYFIFQSLPVAFEKSQNVWAYWLWYFLSSMSRYNIYILYSIQGLSLKMKFITIIINTLGLDFSRFVTFLFHFLFCLSNHNRFSVLYIVFKTTDNVYLFEIQIRSSRPTFVRQITAAAISY